MVRALVLGVTVVLLAGACVSVSAPTTGPTAAPSLGVTTPAPVTVAPTHAPASTPTAAATAIPATPTVEPTTEPTEEPTAESTYEPSAEPTNAAGDEGDLVFADSFDDEGSGWGAIQSDAVSAAYVNGSLQLDVNQTDKAVLSSRVLPEGFAVALLAGEFRPLNDGAFGPLCGGDDGTLHGAVVDSDGNVDFIAIENGQTRILATHDNLVSIPPVGGMLLGVECVGMVTGALRQVAVGADGPLAVYQDNEGPQTFNTVAVYVEATGDGLRVDVDQAAAYGIAGSAEGMTSEGESLLTHVPGDLQSTCYESPSTGSATAVQHCILQVDGTGAELLQFQSYSSNEEMDAAYQEVVAQFGVESTGTCESGPDETTWSVDGAAGGRLQCAPQEAGIRFDWTDDQLVILSTLIDFDVDYKNTYNFWVNAGPVDNPI